MKLKQAILSVMGRDALKNAVDELELDGVDRRSVEDMRSRLSRAHRATPECLLQYLSEGEVKDVCDLVGVPAKGRRGALIEALIDADGRGASRDNEKEKPRGSARGRAAPEQKTEDEDEPTRWMRPEEAQMSEQPTEKPEVMPKREPGRPFQITRTELVWPSKYDEHGNLVEPPRVSLPFQVIEVIEEGRTSREGLKQAMLPLFGEKPKGPAEDGWRNKLIWGDNLLVMGSLLKDFAGKIDLIYIDPPFATGADFSVKAKVGESNDLEVEKSATLIEEVAYRDMWGKGSASYLSFIGGRLALMRDLLAQTGSLYVHLDYRLVHYVRMLLDDVFGESCLLNEVIWHYQSGGRSKESFSFKHDTILVYGKNTSPFFDAEAVGIERGSEKRNNMKRGQDPDGRWYWSIKSAGKIYKYYDDEKLTPDDVWSDLSHLQQKDPERTGYPTQKPERLLERVLMASCPRGGLVADVFCGSGTTLAVAEKLGRRWIGCDLGRFAIHTTRKRMLDLRVKDAETGEERGCRPFEVLNLGRYERKYWQGITFGNEPKSDEETALAAYVNFILDLYKAQPVHGTHVHGKKGGAFVHVGAVDAPVTISQIEDASAEAERLGGKELHILGWEFEMGLHDPITQYVRAQHGVVVRLLSIPRETMERRAVEAGDVQFFDLAYLEVEVKPEKGGKKERGIKVRLKDFVIPSTDLIPEEVRAKIKKWSDYIDYWAVDWDFRNDTFVNQWQTYRTRQDRSLALETPVHTYDKPGSYQILVKVVDIFGNDTSHLVKWEVK